MKIDQLSCRSVILTLLLGAVGLSACVDERERSVSPSAVIAFAPEMQPADSAATRALTSVGLPADTVVPLHTSSGRPLYLHTLYADTIASASLTDGQDTPAPVRAQPVGTDNFYDTFGVSAYAYTGDWSDDCTPNYMYDVAVAPSGKVWASANTYYWPGSTCRLRFFAYAPRGNDAYAFSGADAAGAPTLRCVIPAEAGEQKDLLVASTDGLPGDYHQAVPLTFRHALTAVRFVCGDDMRPGTIRRITLKEVCTSGVYDLGAARWSSVDNPSAFVQELDTPTEGTADVPLTTGPQTFMMLPQTLPAGAKIEILFNDGTEDHLLTASIGGTLWPMGKTVTYRISTTSINWVYTLEAKGPRPYSFRGEYDEYAVTSYRTHVVTGQQEPVAWSETYSLDGGKSWTDVPPRWTNGFVGSGEGSTKPRSYSLYVREQAPVIHNGAAEKLMNTPPRGTADRPWNLSNRTGADAVENTANCYVINGPGHYCFPLVYGNAIRNGADNPAAYSSTSTNPYVLKQFVNYINYPITKPYIDEGYAYPLTSAEILWQDEPGLVTDVRYHAEPGRGTISFAVPRETIKEGNAVIVLKDERGQVIWSWHIWVTSADVEQTIRVKTFHAKEAYVRVFEFMPVNLGWCGMAEVEYPGRKCLVKFTAGELSRVITVRQEEYTYHYAGCGTYYQWGRKEPFPGSGFNAWQEKNLYDGADRLIVSSYPGKGYATEYYLTAWSAGAVSLYNGIRNPMYLNRTSGNTFYNLWNAINDAPTWYHAAYGPGVIYGHREGGYPTYVINPMESDNRVVKTVYDPSPPGFHVPPVTAFTRCAVLKEGPPVMADANGTWDDTQKGFRFYCDETKSGTVFLPAQGMRTYVNGKVVDYAKFGYYWTAGNAYRDHKPGPAPAPPADAPSCGHTMMFRGDVKVVDPFTCSGHAYALPVRAVREEAN